MFTDKNVAFIGSGIMGEAMIRGLITQNIVAPEQIYAADPMPSRLEELRERYGIRVTSHNAEAAEAGQVIVLSTKPQNLAEVTPGIRGHLRRQDLLLSILAGTPIRKLADGVAHASVVRAMPNTPAQIGMGMTVWTATPEVTEEQRGQAQAILGALGQELFVNDEAYLDMATALSGTGPAYVFMFMESLIDAGVHLGFSRRVAEQLVFQTMRGSLEYAAQSGKHVAELRNQVTSPGGTTAAALYQMEKGGLRTVISRAIWAAYQRSVELGQGEKVKGPA
ncbi:Pyrroline-5-carboxylate reductase [Candidatus Promineifilum breve]|uniref:Pyrroline-5-carboxylate reductase n=1 Tax=Candidatus Promineifilum breve TaxID=1806508 RepID=A0A160T7C1_9CHLR|nr:pyrroline-5-carboxylate reductase [Candidatus Promineifilum breve]CUS04975.2 Pyrroline-5-carboxylate reductase [Candidatus Promineifilum breve]